MATSDLLMTEDGDLDLSARDIQLSSGTAAIIQRIKQAYRLFLGEWFLNSNEGIPFFDYVFIHNPDRKTIKDLFLKVLVDDEDIKSVTQFDISVDATTRVLSITFAASTSSGEIESTTIYV